MDTGNIMIFHEMFLVSVRMPQLEFSSIEARPVACPLLKQLSQDQPLHPAHSFVENFSPTSADSRRASCQLLAKERALIIGKLPLGGFPRYCG